MKKILVQSIEEYHQWRRGMTHTHESVSLESFPPLVFPCVIVYETVDDPHSAKDFLEYEFIFLSDFDTNSS